MPSVLFPTFNPSKFALSLCLEAFSVVLALRLDEFLVCSYWLVFVPLWCLGAVALVGGVTGIIAWSKKDRRTLSDVERKGFQQMVLVTLYHLFLLAFEVMVCANLESSTGKPYLNWGAIFLPLLIVAFVSCFSFFFWKLFSRQASASFSLFSLFDHRLRTHVLKLPAHTLSFSLSLAAPV